MIGVLARMILLLAVATPPIQMACDGTSDAPPRFDDTPDTGEIFTTADGVRFRAQVVATNLEIAWALSFAPDGRLFVTERPGRVRIVENGQLLDVPALMLTDVYTEGEAGLLGIALDPDFERNRFVYVLYSATRTGRSPVNRIARFLETNGRLVDAVTILDDIPAHPLHDGGRLKFGPNGNLYRLSGTRHVRRARRTLASSPARFCESRPTARRHPTIRSRPRSIRMNIAIRRVLLGIRSTVTSVPPSTATSETMSSIGSRQEPNYGWPPLEGDETMVGMHQPSSFSHPQSRRLEPRSTPGRCFQSTETTRSLRPSVGHIFIA